MDVFHRKFAQLYTRLSLELPLGVPPLCLFLQSNGIKQLAELLNKPAVCL